MNNILQNYFYYDYIARNMRYINEYIDTGTG